MKKLMLALGISFRVILPSAWAHHSFQAEYDQSKPLTLVGKVTNVVTDNPHGWIYLDAKNAQGKVVNWALELPAPNVLRRNGFDRSIYQTLMTSGEEITVTAYAAKDGSKHGWAGGLTCCDLPCREKRIVMAARPAACRTAAGTGR